MNFDALSTFLKERGEKPYRLAQVKQAFFVDLFPDWDSVTVFSKEFREAAKAELVWDELALVKREESDHGQTVKFLFQCSDGANIETVIMRHLKGRNTVCVSSQVGCPMACSFCATGTMGFRRNLTREEIVDQAVCAARYLKAKGEHLSNLVVMGMGEPFHNYDAVVSALKIVNDQKGLCLGARHMSISTCGIVPGILKLADEPIQLNMAISLHGAINAVRSRLMPVNEVYPIEKLMSAVRIYMEKTNRKVMFEYLLIAGVNDREEDAVALANLLRPYARLAHVNLIKYHPTGAYSATEREARERFQTWLHELGVSSTYRITFGEEIDAACGQLAVRKENGKLHRGLAAAKIGRAHRKSAFRHSKV